MKKETINTKKVEPYTCSNKALFRYTWAGRDESFICLEHSGMLWAVANACGYHLQMILLQATEEITCRQVVS